MAARIGLIGGEEFEAGFENVHSYLYDLVKKGKRRPGKVSIVYLPTCAAHDGIDTVNSWCSQAHEKLAFEGADVNAPLIIDRASADDPDHADLIAKADWIYIGGGYPHIGMAILTGTRSMEALEQAREHAQLISGASAGAMLLCSHSWVITPELNEAVEQAMESGLDMSQVDIPIPPTLRCMGMIDNTLCWPHFNMFFSEKFLNNGGVPQGVNLIGVDEQTLALTEMGSDWQVLGKGRVVVRFGPEPLRVFHNRQSFQLKLSLEL